MANKKNFTIVVKPEDVVYTNISKRKDEYNSARMVVKVAEKEYMSVGYEWEGEHVPDFVMNLMGFMQSNQIETSGIWPDKDEEYKEFTGEPDTGGA